MNEKIEERNEELHKLRKKITTTVVILTHTREKFQYIKKQNEKKELELKSLTGDLTDIKTKLSGLKKKREDEAKRYQKLKQQTGIVSQSSLKDDYSNRAIELKELQEKIQNLDQKH